MDGYGKEFVYRLLQVTQRRDGMQRLTRKLAVREIPFEDARLDGTQPLQTFIFGNGVPPCIDLDSVKTKFDDR